MVDNSYIKVTETVCVSKELWPSQDKLPLDKTDYQFCFYFSLKNKIENGHSTSQSSVLTSSSRGL